MHDMMDAIVSLVTLFLVVFGTCGGGSIGPHPTAAEAVAPPARAMAAMDYWHAVLPDTPMPQAIHDLLLTQSTGQHDSRKVTTSYGSQGEEALREVSSSYGSQGQDDSRKATTTYMSQGEEISTSYGSQGQDDSRKATMSYMSQGEEGLSLREVSTSYGSQGQDDSRMATTSYMSQGKQGLREVSTSYGSQGQDDSRKITTSYGYQGKEGLREVSTSYGSQGQDGSRKTTMSYESKGKEGLREVSTSYGSQRQEDSRKVTMSYGSQGEDDKREVSTSYGSQGEDNSRMVTTSYGSQGEDLWEVSTPYGPQGEQDSRMVTTSYGSQGQEDSRKIMMSYRSKCHHCKDSRKTPTSYGARSMKPSLKIVTSDKQQSTSEKGGWHRHDHVHHSHSNGNQLADVFFFHDVLRPGSVVTPTIPLTTSLPPLLHRHEADSLPFSTERFADIVALFAPASLGMAEEMRWTLDTCEHPRPLPGEKAGCATSLESLARLPAALLGTRNVRAFSGDMPIDPAGTPAQRGRYNVTAVVKLSDSPTAATCHDLTYPYAVFYCHTTNPAATYKVTLVAQDGGAGAPAMEALAVCHLDTSLWSPSQPFLAAHNLKPGEVAVCHFLSKLSIIWVPGPASEQQGSARDTR